MWLHISELTARTKVWSSDATELMHPTNQDSIGLLSKASSSVLRISLLLGPARPWPLLFKIDWLIGEWRIPACGWCVTDWLCLSFDDLAADMNPSNGVRIFSFLSSIFYLRTCSLLWRHNHLRSFGGWAGSEIALHLWPSGYFWQNIIYYYYCCCYYYYFYYFGTCHPSGT